RKQRLDLRAEKKSSRRLRIDQRLHAEAVARKRKALFVPVPDGEGEHSAQVSEAALQPLAREKAQQHLGVRAAAKAPSLPLERMAELLEFVALRVEDDDVAPVGRRHRLVPRLGQVDDGEPSKTQARFALAPGPLVVGAAMFETRDSFVQTHLGPRT